MQRGEVRWGELSWNKCLLWKTNCSLDYNSTDEFMFQLELVDSTENLKWETVARHYQLRYGLILRFWNQPVDGAFHWWTNSTSQHLENCCKLACLLGMLWPLGSFWKAGQQHVWIKNANGCRFANANHQNIHAFLRAEREHIPTGLNWIVDPNV